MKVKINPDGSEELEGTEEEISAYRNKKKKTEGKEAPKSGKKRLLTEDEVRTMAREEIAKAPKSITVIGGNCKCPHCQYPWLYPQGQVYPYGQTWITCTSGDVDAGAVQQSQGFCGNSSSEVKFNTEVDSVFSGKYFFAAKD